MKKILFYTSSLLLLTILIFGARKTQFDNTRWLPNEHPVEKTKLEIQKIFQQNESLLVSLEFKETFFSPQNIQTLRELSAELLKIPAIQKVQNPLRLKNSFKRESLVEFISFDEALEKKVLKNEKDFKEEFEKNPFARRFLSPDHKSVLISLDIPVDLKMKDRLSFRQKSIDQVRAVLNASSVSYRLAGELYLNSILDHENRSNLVQLLPLAFFILLFFLILYYRSFFILYVSLSCSCICVFACLNLFILLGKSMSISAVVVPLLLFSIAISDSLHIFEKWKFTDSKKELFQKIWKPCLLTSLSSAFGFGVFATSELLPLKDLGIMGAISISLSYFFVVGYTYSAICFFPEAAKKVSKTPKLLAMQEPFLKILSKHKIKRAISYALFLLSFLTFPFAFSESNLLDIFFSDQDRIYQDFSFIDSNLGGTGRLNLLFRNQEKDYFKGIGRFEKISKLQTQLQKDPQILSSFTYVDPLQILHTSLRSDQSLLPETQEALEQEILFLEFSRSDASEDVLTPYTNFDYNLLRLEINTPNLNSRSIKNLMDRIDVYLKMPHEFAGSSFYFFSLNEYVLQTQTISILAGLTMLFFVLYLSYGLKNALAGFVATALPLSLVIACVILLGRPFDLSTVLIASICMGLSIDNSIHLIHTYEHQKVKDWREVFRQSFPVLSLVFGLFFLSFLSFLLSNLVMLRNFGFYCALMMFFSWIANFTILPAFLNFHEEQ